MADGPREIKPHAWQRPVGPDPNNAPHSYQTFVETYGFKKCAVEGCGLEYDAPVHWRMAVEEAVEQPVPVAPGTKAHTFSGWSTADGKAPRSGW